MVTRTIDRGKHRPLLPPRVRRHFLVGYRQGGRRHPADVELPLRNEAGALPGRRQALRLTVGRCHRRWGDLRDLSKLDVLRVVLRRLGHVIVDQRS